MSDPISAAEAAAANAIDANLAQNANSDLASDAIDTSQAHVAALEKQLRDIQAAKARISQMIPHAEHLKVVVPAGTEVQAPQYTLGEMPQGGSAPLVAVSKAPSALLADKQAEYATRPKKQYKYKR